MRVLGLSAFYHDSAAALVDGGRIVAAAQEERFTRRKHDAGFPANAVASCLDQAGIAPRDLDSVVFYEKPFLRFERAFQTGVGFAPHGLRFFSNAGRRWTRERLYRPKSLVRRQLRTLDPEVDWDAKLLFAEHHQSHAASAFYPSGFRDAVVLTMDGVGEWATTTVAVGHGNDLEMTREIRFPHSLGLLYGAFTCHAGFELNSGEGKLMGLAPYGEPRHLQTILDNLIDLKPDGTFRLNLDYFDFCTGSTMTNGRFDALFGCRSRTPGSPLTQEHMDLAASAQAVLEEAVLRLTRSLRAETGLPHLCLAGGVALNCVANGKVLRDGRFADVWIQPAAGDAGGALGAALVASHRLFGEPRGIPGGVIGNGDAMNGAYLGPEFSQEQVRRTLDAAGGRYATLPDDALIEAAASALAAGKTVGWFQGRMEFGPRALGNRSILADARSPAMQEVLNFKVKFRESFRPFAPSVLHADAADWFDVDDSPYMLLTAPVKTARRKPAIGGQDVSGVDRLRLPRSDIPAATHVDYSARVHTVHPDANPRYHALLDAFKARTGCPVVVNTSFNVRGEPIVCNPHDAFLCFMGTGLDCLAIGNCLLRKEEQDPSLARAHADSFEPD